jgi:hypothetical protein
VWLVMNEHLLEAFSSITSKSTPLKVNTIICSVCGCVVSIKNKTKPCRHLATLAQDFVDDEQQGTAISKFDIIAV